MVTEHYTVIIFSQYWIHLSYFWLCVLPQWLPAHRDSADQRAGITPRSAPACINKIFEYLPLATSPVNDEPDPSCPTGVSLNSALIVPTASGLTPSVCPMTLTSKGQVFDEKRLPEEQLTVHGKSGGQSILRNAAKGFPPSITSGANMSKPSLWTLKHTELFHTTQFDGAGCRGHCHFASPEAKSLSYSPGLGRIKVEEEEDHFSLHSFQDRLSHFFRNPAMTPHGLGSLSALLISLNAKACHAIICFKPPHLASTHFAIPAIMWNHNPAPRLPGKSISSEP